MEKCIKKGITITTPQNILIKFDLAGVSKPLKMKLNNLLFRRFPCKNRNGRNTGVQGSLSDHKDYDMDRNGGGVMEMDLRGKLDNRRNRSLKDVFKVERR